MDFEDNEFFPALIKELKLNKSAKLKNNFHEQPMTTMLTLLSLCHTVVTNTSKDKDND